MLARGTVRYVGEPIAAVVAESRYVAEDAARAVTVEYEPLDVVADAETALAPGAPVLHAHLGDNLLAEFVETVGDADRSFATPPVVTRGRYDVHRHTGMPMETRGVAADPDRATGGLVLWTSTQWPHTRARRPEQRARARRCSGSA